MPTILIVTANSRVNYLNLREEVRVIEKELTSKSSYRILIEWEANIEDLIRRLADEQPEILHFAGHGLGGGQQAIVLSGANGRPVMLSAENLADIFRVLRVKPRLVVLNACSSAELIQVISQYVDVVIGMDSQITDEYALCFSQHFYSALGRSLSIGEACMLARMPVEKARPTPNPIVISSRDGVSISDVVFYGYPQLLARFVLVKEKPIIDKSSNLYNIILWLRGVDREFDSATFQVCHDTFPKKDRFWEILRAEHAAFLTDDFWTSGDVNIRFVAWSKATGIGGESTVSEALERFYGNISSPHIQEAINYIKTN